MADQLFEEWRVYETLLVHDYMDHRAFFARLQQEIVARFDRPVTMLDIGCGDLTPMLPLLRDTPVRRYVGIDEASAALAVAARRLREFPFESRLVDGDLRVRLAELQGPFDVIVASFSLHHLADDADKLAAFAACRRLLDAGGFVALIDVFSGERESRERYVERWIAHADARYAALAPEQKSLLFEHVRARDYPLSVDRCRALARSVGLHRCDVLLEDAARLNRLVALA